MIADFIYFVSNSLTVTVLVGYIFALWAALVVWTWIDISSRTSNIPYRLGAVLIVVTGAALGFAIYLLLRPSLTKEDAQLREVEEAILASQSQFQSCPDCYNIVREDFAFCPNCATKLLTACPHCNRETNIAWKVCPYCGERQKVVEAVPVKAAPLIGLKNRSFVFFSGVTSFIKKINANKNLSRRKTRRTNNPKSKKTSRSSKRKAS